MSLKTWKKEFYPTAPTKCKTEKAAVKHSLQKWTGALKENLKKHELECASSGLFEVGTDDVDSSFYFDEHTCALCKVHRDTEGCVKCEDCVLFGLRDGRSCDIGAGAPYITFLTTNNPKPMISILKKALKKLEKSR